MVDEGLQEHGLITQFSRRAVNDVRGPGEGLKNLRCVQGASGIAGRKHDVVDVGNRRAAEDGAMSAGE